MVERKRFAASCGLAGWFHNCDRKALAAKLPLCKAQRVLLAQTVGFPVAGAGAGP